VELVDDVEPLRGVDRAQVGHARAAAEADDDVESAAACLLVELEGFHGRLPVVVDVEVVAVGLQRRGEDGPHERGEGPHRVDHNVVIGEGRPQLLGVGRIQTQRTAGSADGGGHPLGTVQVDVGHRQHRGTAELGNRADRPPAHRAGAAHRDDAERVV
jgi:hypothetical protein